MIDAQTLKEHISLLALVEQSTALKHVASTQGGEWAGPCPFCGGVDRFHVQPNCPSGGRWMCRHCSPRWQDTIAFVMKRDNLGFKAACTLLAGGDLPEGRMFARKQSLPQPAYDAPASDWQAQARQAIDICAGNLWDKASAQALDYLRGRGLADDTIRYFRLGFSPGARFGDLWIPRGVVMPCMAAGEIWYIKISLLPGDPVRCEKCDAQALARMPCPKCGAVNKYRGVKGNRQAAIFNAGDLVGAELALFTEGEFDAMIAWQELRDVVAVATLGSSTNHPDLATWGAYLLSLRYILVLYDQDKAGKAGSVVWADLTDRAQICRLPEGVKDVNDFTRAGGELWPWLRAELARLGVLEGLGIC